MSGPGGLGIKRFERITAGGPSITAAPAALCYLALRLRHHASQIGLTPLALKASKIAASGTRVLRLKDGRGREWLVRVACIPLPAHSGHDELHLDLVSRDGLSGFEAACAYLDSISRGEVEWRRPHRRPCPKVRR